MTTTTNPTTVQIPSFPERHHPLVKSLANHSDHDLVTLFQHYPEQGRFFVALFCRYSPIIYSLIRHSARSPVQADYLFALTWRHIYFELGGLDLRDPNDQGIITLQNWLINITAICINNAELPSVELINYSIKQAPPPLWCYVSKSLELLPPVMRLVLIMAQTFHWSDIRIAAYLQAEGEKISRSGVKTLLEQAFTHLENIVPEDIQIIYAETWKNLSSN